DVTVGAPIAAEIQDDAFVGSGGRGKRRGQIGFRLRGSRIDVRLHRARGGRRAQQQANRDRRSPAQTKSNHAKPSRPPCPAAAKNFSTSRQETKPAGRPSSSTMGTQEKRWVSSSVTASDTV